MGYSCTVAADKVLDNISKKCLAQTQSQNCFEVNGTSYFWERGREQVDGAITGSIWKIIAKGQHKGKCIRAGSFRIEADGILSRWTHGKKSLTSLQ